MKKRIIALLCVLLLWVSAQTSVLAASDSMDISIDGRSLTLAFDRSEQFSNIADGMVQASFYTYLDDSNDLYELYLIFPRDVQSGATIDSDYARQNAPDTSVVMIVTTAASVDYYFAGQAEDTDFTDFSLNFEAVSDSDGGRTYSGSFSATMIGMSAEDETELKPLDIHDARFSFTMPLDNRSDIPAPDDPFEDDGFDAPASGKDVYKV